MKQFEINLTPFFSLDKTLMSEQCAADLWFFDNREKYWVSYVPIKTQWTKVMLKQRENTIKVKYMPSDHNIEEIKNRLFYIFSLNYNVNHLIKTFQKDKYLQKVLKYCANLRIMRDIDKKYRIMEAIITQNTSVKMIKIIQRLLFLNYGNKVKIGDELIHIYPEVEKIANEKEAVLREKCKLGYRAEYLKNMAQKILSKEIEIENLEKMKTEEAKKYLMTFKGIGSKVSDLILMYGFEKNDVFPLDLWIKRTIKREYFQNKEVSDKQIYEFAKNYFGPYASMINLMIFSYERKNKNQFFNYCIWR